MAEQVTSRLAELLAVHELPRVVLPVGLLLVLDRRNGGDATSDELIRRFALLDGESANYLDFYYLGWTDESGTLEFDLEAFLMFREMLSEHGIVSWGGSADLILADAIGSRSGGSELSFRNAIHIDLAKALKRGDIDTLGSFTQTVLRVCQDLHERKGAATASTFDISDRLGIVYGTESLLDYFLDRFGKIFGAKRLRAFATKAVGPSIPIAGLRQAEEGE